MLSKLPAWVGLGAFLLALCAGVVNVFVLESLAHHAVTHHSGNTSSFVLSVVKGDYPMALEFLALILSFAAGSVLSGFVIRDSHLKLGRRYGVSLMIESGIILLAWALFDERPVAGQMLLAGASGLQNAMASTYSGAVLRTTHLTGIYTDIGIMFGNSLAGMPLPARKLKLLCAILAGFVAGGALGALFFPAIGNAVLAVPAALTGGIGAAYIVYRRFFQRPQVVESR